MLEYPSIPSSKESVNHIGKNVICTYKYDGQNLRWERNKKNWIKSGSRTSIFDSTATHFSDAITLFNSISPHIDEVISKNFNNFNNITVFTEFYGEKSIAGIHKKDDPKKLKFFDIAINNEFLPTKLFYKYFGHLDFVAEIIYKGILTEEFINNVKEDNLNVPLFEGVIVNVSDKNKFKIKTNKYKELLKEIYEGNWEKFYE